MKTKILTGVMIAMMLGVQISFAQKLDEERMTRDIAVAENVLSTLIKQQVSNQRTFFPLEIKGNYQPGYGVTFNLPADFTTPISFLAAPGMSGDVLIWGNTPNTPGVQVQQFNYDNSDDRNDQVKITNEKEYKLKTRTDRKQINLDSIRDVYNQRVIDASKTFIVDYADMIAQLQPGERVVISNQGNQPRMWVGRYFDAPQRTHLSIEAVKSDITQFRQGKITREQALAKIKVVNTETVNDVEPDLELFSSIIGRLYTQDLSKTFFIGDQIYFERLKDFGAIYYMQVYSGIERGEFSNRYVMPTLGLDDVDQETKDKKVKEMYPKFEKELKENMLEYGRTIKSLKDEESLVIQVTVTRCKGCNIPSTLELSVKGSVLKDFNAGKVDQNAAMSKINVKKGANQ
ncbi:MAG TPA: hypothetical protein VK589_26505 [Chryseolinea sp.]|nr:hypothetical protein [Chryseolinea sp.]